MNVLTAPCVSRSARSTRFFADDEVPEDQLVFVELNAELAELWPNITEIKDSPADAKEWEGKPGKLALLER